MDQQPNNLPHSEELQDAIRELESYPTEQLESMAKQLGESTKPLYGKNELVTALSVLIKARRAYGAPLN